MLNKIIYTLLFLVFPYGQQNPRKEITGKLLPATKNLDLETIYVYNKTSGKGILSNFEGNFKLAMRLGDTIIASAMQIDPSELVIKEMHLNDGFITLAIQADMEYLEEVRLSNRSLTGNLDLDMKMLSTKPVITSADLGFAVTQNDRTTGERMLSSYTSSPVEFLLAALSGNLKQARQRVELEKYESNRQFFIKRMPTQFYTNNLKIPTDNIPHFIEYCESKEEIGKLISMPIDELVEFLQKTAVLYKDNYPERF